MGNSGSELLNWQEVKVKAKQVSPCDAHESLIRLNIPMRDSQHTNDENKEENKQNNDILQEYLMDYLSLPSNEETLNRLLQSNDIDPKSCSDNKDKIQCLSIVSSPDFWRTNYTLHPNSSRVRNWLWIHQRYRDQVEEFVKKSATLDTNINNKQAVLDDVKSSFEKFTNKLEKHTEFEETMLLKFMIENLPKNVIPHYDQLHSQHDKNIPEITKKINEFFQNNTNNIQDYKPLIGLLKEYLNDLLEHLKLEEQCLVGIWLNLTPDLYKTYRSYLSWKYAPMY